MRRTSQGAAALAAGISLILIMSPLVTVAQGDFSPVYKPSLHIGRVAGEIRIDGWLNDPGWRRAAVADHFVESSPGDQIEPPVATRAMMTYDDQYLFVAIVAQADPKQVRASLCERDRTPGDDNLGVFIDTYGDAAWAYMFFVNAHGIQYDAIWSSVYGTDTGYDLIWEAAGQITDSGFQVEIAIPFASLRFPNRPEQEWRVEFHRYHEREVTYELTWSAYDRDESCWPCQWGSVTGISDVRPGRGVEIIPALVGFQAGALNSRPRYAESDSGLVRIGDSLPFDNEDVDGDVSVSAKYALSSNSTIEFTVNPDFSQVEADADQIDVNSTTALSFPEKRPFFQEGSDLFRSRFSVVYTRSINEPDVAAKFTYRKGRSAVAYLGAHDRTSPIILPFSEFSSDVIEGGKSFSNIVRARQTFGTNSWVGLLATDRRLDGGGSGSTLGLDGILRLTKSLKFNWQLTGSHTSEPDDTTITSGQRYYDFRGDSLVYYNEFLFDGKHTAAYDGESFRGHAVLADFDFEIRNFWATSAYLEKSPTFRTDNGMETLNDRRYADFVAGYVFRFDQGLLESIRPDFSVYRVWNRDGKFKDEGAETNVSFYLRWMQVANHNQYAVGSEMYADSLFEGLWAAHHCLSSTPSQYVSFGGSINYGHKIARGYREMGSERYYTSWIDLQPINRLLWENSFSHITYTSVNTGVELFKGYIFRSKLSYHFNRKLWLRFVTQYNDFREAWDLDPLLTYQINPFTLFYVGTTYDYRTYHGMDSEGVCYVDNPEMDACHSHTKLSGRQFFMKLQYLFQL